MENLTKKLPFTKEMIEKIIEKYPTPFYIYDEKNIIKNAREFLKAFSILNGFKEFFAVKANPNPHIQKILKNEGIGADCSSMGELVLAERVGLKGDDIMFSSNNTPVAEYKKAFELNAIINLDDITSIDILFDNVGIPDIISCRYNPGPLKEGNAIIGKPEEAKYGFMREQIFEGLKKMKERGVKRFGLHTMVASNELNNDYFIETAKIMFELVTEVKKRIDIDIEFVNLGGGMGIPYKLDQKKLDYNYIANGIKSLYDNNGFKNLKIFLECGRIITGPYGYLVSKAINKKEIYKNYIGLDSCMSSLMRPAIYGAYHHITVLGKEDKPLDYTYDVVGSLCENNDKFAIDRKLPKIDIEDIIVIHDGGAHGYAMGFNYNAKLRPKELLLKEDSSIKLIRREETLDDYFATIDFSKM